MGRNSNRNLKHQERIQRDRVESPTVPFPPYRETYDTPANEGGTYLSYRSETDVAGAPPRTSQAQDAKAPHISYPSSNGVQDNTYSKIPQASSIPPKNNNQSRQTRRSSPGSHVHPGESYADALEMPREAVSFDAHRENRREAVAIQPIRRDDGSTFDIKLIMTREERERLDKGGRVHKTEDNSHFIVHPPMPVRDRSHVQNSETPRKSEREQREMDANDQQSLSMLQQTNKTKTDGEGSSSYLQEAEKRGRDAIDLTESKMSGALSSAHSTARETMNSLGANIRHLSGRTADRGSVAFSAGISDYHDRPDHPDPTDKIYNLADRREENMNKENTMRTTMTGVDVMTPNDLRSEPADGLRGAVEDISRSRVKPWSEQPLVLALAWLGVVGAIYYGWVVLGLGDGVVKIVEGGVRD